MRTDEEFLGRRLTEADHRSVAGRLAHRDNERLPAFEDMMLIMDAMFERLGPPFTDLVGREPDPGRGRGARGPGRRGARTSDPGSSA